MYKIGGSGRRRNGVWDWPRVTVEAIGREPHDDPYFVIGKQENGEQYAIVSKTQAQRIVIALARGIRATNAPAPRGRDQHVRKAHA